MKKGLLTSLVSASLLTTPLIATTQEAQSYSLTTEIALDPLENILEDLPPTEFPFENEIENYSPIQLAGGFSLDQEEFTFDGHTLPTNFATFSELLNQGLSFFEPDQEGFDSFALRTLYLSAAIYANLALILLPNHELGHFITMQRAGLENSYIDLSNILILSGRTHYPDDEAFDQLTFQERMMIAGSGIQANTLLSRELLQREPNISNQLNYFLSHNNISFFVLNTILNEEFNSVQLSIPSDYIHYNNALFSYYNQTPINEKNLFFNPHQIDVAFFNFVDPYSLAALHDLVEYSVNGNQEITTPPAYLPQLNGYWGFLSPQYELAWYLPCDGGTLNLDARVGFFPEFTSGLGIHFIEIPLNNINITLGGELIYQENSIQDFARDTFGYTFDARIGFSIEDIIFQPYLLRQSSGVWSPRRFGIEENTILGIEIDLSSPF